jgi:hypothetical protein
MRSAKTIFKNYAAKSMDEVCDKLVEAALYIERNPKMGQIHDVVFIHHEFTVIRQWYEKERRLALEIL